MEQSIFAIGYGHHGRRRSPRWYVSIKRNMARIKIYANSSIGQKHMVS